MGGRCCSSMCWCIRFHAVVSQLTGLDIRVDVRRLRSNVIIMHTLAAANFSEAFLALEVTTDFFDGVPLQLILFCRFFILVSRMVLLPIINLWLSVAQIELVD